MKKTEKMSVECMECGKKFKTGSIYPKCPRCKGSDIDLAKEERVTCFRCGWGPIGCKNEPTGCAKLKVGPPWN